MNTAAKERVIVELDDGVWMTRFDVTKNWRLAYPCVHDAEADGRLLHRRRKEYGVVTLKELHARIATGRPWPRASFRRVLLKGADGRLSNLGPPRWPAGTSAWLSALKKDTPNPETATDPELGASETVVDPAPALIPAVPSALLNVDRGRPFQRYDPDSGERVQLDGRPMRKQTTDFGVTPRKERSK